MLFFYLYKNNCFLLSFIIQYTIIHNFHILNIASAIKEMTGNEPNPETLSLKTIINKFNLLKKEVFTQLNILKEKICCYLQPNSWKNT